jgi:23S rRNA (uracil1939-C5)-methyltransferase
MPDQRDCNDPATSGAACAILPRMLDRLRPRDLLPFRITRLADSDGSRADVSGREVRVPGGVPGDSGMLRITHVGQHAAWGRIETLEQPSPDRVTPPCPVVERCGGCPWQMVSLSAQMQARLATLHGLLDPVAVTARWHQPPGEPRTTGYRTRALMMTRRKPGGILRFGFFAPGSHDLVAAEGCIVQHPMVNQTLEGARSILGRSGITAWRDADHPGQLRAVLYRVDPEVGRGLLTLVVTHSEGMIALAEALLDVPGIAGVYANINATEGGPVLGRDTVHLAGADRQRVRYGTLELEVGATAFLQTRHDMAGQMVAAAEALLPAKMNHLVDLYAGVGVFGLAVRDRAERVTLVERDPPAVLDARWNVERLGATHVTAIEEDAAGFVSQLTELAPDCVMLDPPRAGCAPAVIEAVAGLPEGAVVVYASCHPPALARDLKRLVDAGFVVTDVVPMDMFPHTPHVEVLVRLERSASA